MKKISFVCLVGLDQFIDPIIEGLSDDYIVRKFIIRDQQEIYKAIDWADIVWFEWCNETAIIGTNHEGIKGKKVIIRLHSYEVFMDFTKRINWPVVDRLIFVAPHIRGILKEFIPDIENKVKTEIVYNGIDLDLYESTKVDGKYADPTIVTVCRLVSYKRVDDLIRAVKALKTDFQNIKLKIIGDGPQKEALKTLSKTLGVEDNVDFLGKVSDTQDVIKVLKKSHVFALPSIVEGFGMVIIEAMAAGIPYVASDIRSIREVTNGGVGGLLSKPKNCEDLALKIKILLVDESKRNSVMKNASKHIKNYKWNNLACKLEKWYGELCGGGQ